MRLPLSFIRGLCFMMLPTLWGCSIMATRPIQEMSDSASALRAAREVQADVLSPELYRRANELFFQARREYKFKNFAHAKELANRSRQLAEQSEFDAIRGGAARNETSVSDDPFGDAPPTLPPVEKPKKPDAPYDYPSADPIPADVYDQRMKEKNATQQMPAATPSPRPLIQ